MFHDQHKLHDVGFHYRGVQALNVRICCPACGHIVGARMNWGAAPMETFTIQKPSMEDSQVMVDVPIHRINVLAFCPSCQSWFVQQEVVGENAESVYAFANKVQK